MDWQKLFAAVAAGASIAGGSGYLGYEKRDSEIEAALDRAKCKITDLKDIAQVCGWERPVDWCVPLEEQ